MTLGYKVFTTSVSWSAWAPGWGKELTQQRLRNLHQLGARFRSSQGFVTSSAACHASLEVPSVPSDKQDPSNSKPLWTPEGFSAAAVKSRSKLSGKQKPHQLSLAFSASEASRSVSVLDLPHPILGYNNLQYEMMDYDHLKKMHISWMLGGQIPSLGFSLLPPTQQPAASSTAPHVPLPSKITHADVRSSTMLTQQLGSEQASDSVLSEISDRTLVGFSVKEVGDRLCLIQLCHENRVLLLRIPSCNDGLGRTQSRDDISSPLERLCEVDSGSSAAFHSSKSHRNGQPGARSDHTQQQEQQQRLLGQSFPARTALASVLQAEHHIATAGLMILRSALLVASRLGVITNHGMDLAAARNTGGGPRKPRNLYSLFELETGIKLPLVETHSHEWDNITLSGEQVRGARTKGEYSLC